MPGPKPFYRGWGRRTAFLGALLALLPIACERSGRGAHEAAFPVSEGRIVLPGHSMSLEILRDAGGVPHVYAQSEADAYFGLGFAHAQDRLAHMVWLRAAARGRSAEWLGEAGVAGDRLARTLGIGHHADAEVSRLDTKTRARLEAYARGVNARLERIRSGVAALPLALRQAGTPLEDWSPADSLALVKHWSWGLSETLEATEWLVAVVRHLGASRSRRYFPERPPSASFPAPTERAAQSGSWRDPLRAMAGLRSRHAGSSAWVVAGEAARGGSPLLAADAHLEATIPAALYVAHIRGGELEVLGATLPGVPVFWTGSNRSVAWAATNALLSVTDVFHESVRLDDPPRYFNGRRWKPLKVRHEILRVREGEERSLAVYETPRGPLIHSFVGDPDEPRSIGWGGTRPGNGVGALMAAARARSAPLFRRRLATHHEPVLALVFADARGDGGLQVAGFVPDRPEPTGLVPVPGPSGFHDWKGRIPFARLPRASLAEQPWVIAADDHLPVPVGEDPDAPEPLLEPLWRTGERSKRIATRLRHAQSNGDIDVHALMAIQTDPHLARSTRLIRTALALLEPSALSPEAAEVAERLRAWDGDAHVGSVEASLYHAFLERLVAGMLGPELGPDLLTRYLALARGNPVAVLSEMLEEVAGRAAGRARREAGALVRDTLERTWLDLSVRAGANREKWAWGRFHRLFFRPLYPGANGGRALGPYPLPGGGLSVALSEYELGGDFEVRAISGFRWVVDTSELDKAHVALAPGQSGHPQHPHAADGVARWLAAKPGLLVTDPLVLAERAAATLTIEPVP